MWHVMRYYAHFGHTDFVLCLGYGASYVKDFFLNYDETRSNDFVLEGGDARQPKLFRTDISEWRITFVDTGLHSADRRAAAPGAPVRRGRGDVPGQLRGRLHRRAAAGHDRPDPGRATRWPACWPFRSQSSHHVVDVGDDGLITKVTPVRDLRQWENGGYFVMRPEIFDYLNEGEDLVEDALPRLIAQGRVLGLPAQGVLVARRHGEGTRPAGGDVPPRELPVDALGPGAVGRRWPDRPGARDDPGRHVGARLSRRDLLAADAAARRGHCPFSRSGRTRTTSRSAPAACSLAWPKVSCWPRTWS